MFLLCIYLINSAFEIDHSVTMKFMGIIYVSNNANDRRLDTFMYALLGVTVFSLRCVTIKHLH